MGLYALLATSDSWLFRRRPRTKRTAGATAVAAPLSGAKPISSTRRSPAASDGRHRRGRTRPASRPSSEPLRLLLRWGGRLAATYAWSSAVRSSVRCTRLTRVTLERIVGSVHPNTARPCSTRRSSIRRRSSVTCTALTGVTPAMIGSSQTLMTSTPLTPTSLRRARDPASATQEGTR